MHTETINLTIAGIDHDKCLVNFEYSSADAGAPDQPPYDEELTIYRVQIPHNDYHGYNFEWWTDLQADYFHLVNEQVLDWIHAKQEDAELDRQLEEAVL